MRKGMNDTGMGMRGHKGAAGKASQINNASIATHAGPSRRGAPAGPKGGESTVGKSNLKGAAQSAQKEPSQGPARKAAQAKVSTKGSHKMVRS